MKSVTAVATALLVLIGAAAAAEPGPGRTVEVTCKTNASQTYTCYLPKAYTPEKKWPILYCFSPNARGDYFVQRYRNVCEERGWIVVGSMNSKNGPWEPIKEAIGAMWADTAERFNLSATMRYATGFSGGARVSFGVAEMHPKEISGVIAIGAGLHSGASLPRKGQAIWLMCGEGDPNKRELDPLHARLTKEGYAVEYRNFPGGHVMPEIPLLEEAVRWMDEQAVERKIERLHLAFADAQALAAEDKAVEAWLTLADALERSRGVKAPRRDMEKLLGQLERDPGVKREVAARKKYDSALKWKEKNGARIAKSSSARAQAVKRFRDVIDRYDGTRAAALAAERVEDLEAGE